MGLDAPSHWIIIALIVIVLFGYKKLPDASRSLARSLRIFKTEIKDGAEAKSAGVTTTDESLRAPSPSSKTTTHPTPAVNGAVPRHVDKSQP